MGENSTLKRRVPSLWRSAYGASRLALTTAMTRVRPSSAVQLLSSSANCRRTGRSSKGARPSMRCPSLSACKGGAAAGGAAAVGGGGRGGDSSMHRSAAAPDPIRCATLAGSYLENELPLVV